MDKTMHNSNDKTDMSIDEIFSTLRKTRLPTVICEGDDDEIVLRKIEEKYMDRMLSVFPVGGRGKVLELFRRRSDLPKTVKFVFVVDRDFWVYSDIPSDYKDKNLIFTDGYSIENDVFRDGRFYDLLLPTERAVFQGELDKFCIWYCHNLEGFMSGHGAKIQTHANKVFNLKMCEGVVLSPNQKRHFAKIRKNYDRLLRGKSLLQLLTRQLGRAGRVPKHHHLSLLEMVSINPGPFIKKIFDRIDRATRPSG